MIKKHCQTLSTKYVVCFRNITQMLLISHSQSYYLQDGSKFSGFPNYVFQANDMQFVANSPFSIGFPQRLQQPYYSQFCCSALFNTENTDIQYYQICLMNLIFKVAVLLLAVVASNAEKGRGAPLKALLYCYLPTYNLTNPMPELINLKNLINQKLADKRINVEVDICDPNNNILYKDSINDYFNTYDILEIDMLAFPKINTPLLKFTKDDVKEYFDDVFAFQWEPLTIHENEQTYFQGSPGITCSDFLEKRSGDYQDVLHVVNGIDKYKFASFYAGLYLNKHPQKTLATMDYSKVEDDLIVEIANFLVKCQSDKTKFSYDDAQCINIDYNTYPASIASTNSQQTLGYSENLYRFFADGVVQHTPEAKSSIEVEHMLGSSPRKIVYVDQFIAKKTDADEQSGRKQTILDFNKYMISDEILQIYAKGLYLSNRHPNQFTYLIPPTVEFFKKLQQQDELYRKIYSELMEGATHSPIYQKEYNQNFRDLAKKIDSALVNYSQSLASTKAEVRDEAL